MEAKSSKIIVSEGDIKPSNPKNWQSYLENNSKFGDIMKLKEESEKLRAELMEITTAIAKTENKIEEARKAEDKMKTDLWKEKKEKQTILQELMEKKRDLEGKIEVLAKEKKTIEEENNRSRVQLQKYDITINEKKTELESLREIVQMKKKTLEEILCDRISMEKEYNEKFEQLDLQQNEIRRKNNMEQQEACQQKIKAYIKEKSQIEEEVFKLNEEKRLIQDIITLYNERLPLLEEKHMLLVNEFRCLMSYGYISRLNLDLLSSQMNKLLEK